MTLDSGSCSTELKYLLNYMNLFFSKQEFCTQSYFYRMTPFFKKKKMKLGLKRLKPCKLSKLRKIRILSKCDVYSCGFVCLFAVFRARTQGNRLCKHAITKLHL